MYILSRFRWGQLENGSTVVYRRRNRGAIEVARSIHGECRLWTTRERLSGNLYRTLECPGIYRRREFEDGSGAAAIAPVVVVP